MPTDVTKILVDNADLITSIYAAMAPIQGECRCIYQCGHCEQLFGRRFIPHGLGHGITINPCSCVMTNNCQKFNLVQEMNP